MNGGHNSLKTIKKIALVEFKKWKNILKTIEEIEPKKTVQVANDYSQIEDLNIEEDSELSEEGKNARSLSDLETSSQGSMIFSRKRGAIVSFNSSSFPKPQKGFIKTIVKKEGSTDLNYSPRSKFMPGVLKNFSSMTSSKIMSTSFVQPYIINHDQEVDEESRKDTILANLDLEDNFNRKKSR